MRHPIDSEKQQLLDIDAIDMCLLTGLAKDQSLTANRKSKQDFPTPLSPIKTNLNR